MVDSHRAKTHPHDRSLRNGRIARQRNKRRIKTKIHHITHVGIVLKQRPRAQRQQSLLIQPITQREYITISLGRRQRPVASVHAEDIVIVGSSLVAVLPKEERNVVGGNLRDDGEEQVVVDEAVAVVDGEAVAGPCGGEGQGSAIVDSDLACGEDCVVDGDVEFEGCWDGCGGCDCRGGVGCASSSDYWDDVGYLGDSTSVELGLFNVKNILLPWHSRFRC